MLSATDGRCVGDHGTILHYTGSAWQTVTSPSTTEWYSISMDSAQDGWASGAGGAVMHYTNGAWKLDAQATITGYDLSSIAMVSATEGWVVGQKDIIRHDHGGQWSTYQV